MGVKILQLHKRSNVHYSACQDKFAYNTFSDRYAIADGTTQSLMSERWAEQLCNTYDKEAPQDGVSLLKLFKHQASLFAQIDYQFNPNPAIASLERRKLKKGATSTFLGVWRTADGWRFLSCGDCGLFTKNEKGITCINFNSVENLSANKDFLNTTNLTDTEATQPTVTEGHIEIGQSSSILLATDALSRLLLKKSEYADQLIRVNSFEELLTLMEQLWEEKVLEEDDLTAVIISPDDSDIVIITPPDSFSFPEAPAPPPFQINPIEQPQISEYDMQQIKESVYRLSAEVKDLRRLLIMLSLVLLVGIPVLITAASLFSGEEENRKVEYIPTDEMERLESAFDQLKDENRKLKNKLAKMEKEAKEITLMQNNTLDKTQSNPKNANSVNGRIGNKETEAGKRDSIKTK